MKLTRFLRMNSNAVNRNRTVVKRATRPSDVFHFLCRLKSDFQTPIIAARNVSVFQRMSLPAGDNAADRRTSRTTSLLIAMAGSYAALWLPFTLISFLLDLDIFFDVSLALFKSMRILKIITNRFILNSMPCEALISVLKSCILWTRIQNFFDS